MVMKATPFASRTLSPKTSRANPRAIVLVDTPNISRSVSRKYDGRCLADYRKLYRLAASVGCISRACALVNDGVSPTFVETLAHIGFDVRRSHAFDCDDALIAEAVRLHRSADIFLLCSGDKHYSRLVEMLRTTGVTVIVCAVDGSCSRRLKSLASGYLEMPVRTRLPGNVPQGPAAAASRNRRKPFDEDE